MQKKGVFISILACCFSSFVCGQGRAAATGTQETATADYSHSISIAGLSGTLWKIVSWPANDEYVGFYEGAVYYVVEGGYSSVDKLTDSFYRDYDYFSIGCAVIPEQLINYPGDVVVWGMLLHSPAIGFGFCLPLPARALLLLQDSEWEPGE